MVTTSLDEQVEAFAESVNGELTSVLLTGLLIVTPASAGSAAVMKREEARDSF
jgi:hypothetical protein